MTKSLMVGLASMVFGFVATPARATTVGAGTFIQFLADIATQNVLTPGSISNQSGIDFNGILPSGTASEDFNPLVVDGVSFSTPTPSTFVNVTTADFYAPTDYSSDFIVNSASGSPTQTLMITFPATYAVGFDLGTFNGGAITFGLSNGFVANLPSSLPLGGTEFKGFVSTEPFTSLSLTVSNDSWVLEDVLLTTPAPEPTTLTLTALGLGAAFVRHRRKRSR